MPGRYGARVERARLDGRILRRSRYHQVDLARSHGDLVRLFLARVSLLELDPTVIGRATQPFSATTRILDALHLASASWLRERGGDVRVAAYDRRLAGAAEAIGLELVEVEG